MVITSVMDMTVTALKILPVVLGLDYAKKKFMSVKEIVL